MKKYLLLYRFGPTPRPAPSPDEMQAMYAHFNAWKAKFEADIVDIGDGLKPNGVVCKESSVTDGPYVEGKEVIGGYMIVQVEAIERAIQIANEGPMLKGTGGSVEIRELAGRKG